LEEIQPDFGPHVVSPVSGSQTYTVRTRTHDLQQIIPFPVHTTYISYINYTAEYQVGIYKISLIIKIN